MEMVDVAPFLDRLRKFDGKVSAEGSYYILGGLVRALENVINWILLTDADLSSLSGFIALYREKLAELRHRLDELLPASEQARFQSLQQKCIDLGFPAEFAKEAASLDYVPSGIGVVDNSRLAGISLGEAAQRFYRVGERLRLGWLRDRLRAVQTTDKWETIAMVGLIMDLRQIQLRLSLMDGDFDQLPGNPVARCDQLLQELELEGQFSLASGDVLARMLGQLAERCRRSSESSEGEALVTR